MIPEVFQAKVTKERFVKELQRQDRIIDEKIRAVRKDLHDEQLQYYKAAMASLQEVNKKLTEVRNKIGLP